MLLLHCIHFGTIQRAERLRLGKHISYGGVDRVLPVSELSTTQANMKFQDCECSGCFLLAVALSHQRGLMIEAVALHRLNKAEGMINYEVTLLNDYVQLCHINALYYVYMYVYCRCQNKSRTRLTLRCLLLQWIERRWGEERAGLPARWRDRRDALVDPRSPVGFKDLTKSAGSNPTLAHAPRTHWSCTCGLQAVWEEAATPTQWTAWTVRSWPCAWLQLPPLPSFPSASRLSRHS